MDNCKIIIFICYFIKKLFLQFQKKKIVETNTSLRNSLSLPPMLNFTFLSLQLKNAKSNNKSNMQHMKAHSIVEFINIYSRTSTAGHNEESLFMARNYRAFVCVCQPGIHVPYTYVCSLASSCASSPIESASV